MEFNLLRLDQLLTDYYHCCVLSTYKLNIDFGSTSSEGHRVDLLNRVMDGYQNISLFVYYTGGAVAGQPSPVDLSRGQSAQCYVRVM